MNDNVKELLEEIQDWMMENDYECGPMGAELFKEISELLQKYDNTTKPKSK